MGAERERNRISSRVDEFPPEAKELLHELLLDTRNTYQFIADELTERGWTISKSAVGRYALRHNAAARRLREASEQTQALFQAIREHQDVEATELAQAILIDGLTKRLATAEEEFDEMPLDKVGRLLIQAQRSTVYKERYSKAKKEALDAVEKTIRARLREEVQNNPMLVAQLERIVTDVTRNEAAKDE